MSNPTEVIQIGDQEAVVHYENPTRPPTVDLQRIPKIVTFEVMESELDMVEAAASEEKNAATFCTGAIGVFAGALIGWPASNADALHVGIFTGVLIAAGVTFLWFAGVWIRKSTARKALSSRIRDRRREVPVVGRAA